MGQAVSSHELFLSGLKEALKTRGACVKKKDLRLFFSYIGELCPWFPLEGTIDGKRWLRVGDCLKDYYESFGPEKVPVPTFSYWNLINEILKSSPFDNGTLKLVRIGEEAMQKTSRPPSACPSVSIDTDPSQSPQDPGNLPGPAQNPTLINKAPTVSNHLYPVLNPGDTLTPGEEATLEKEAAPYHSEDPPPLRTLPQSIGLTHPPPSYIPPAFCAPALQGPTAPSDIFSPLPLPDLAPLRESLQHRREQIQLLKELRSLDSELRSLALGTESTRAGPKAKPSHRPVLAFPVTRSQTDKPAQAEDSEEDLEEEVAERDQGDEAGEGQEEDQGSEDEEFTPRQEETQSVYKKLSLRFLEKLKKACAHYGPTAPYTLALLESHSAQWLTPNDWKFLARATLSAGDFLLWNADFKEHCRETAQKNLTKASSKSWTYVKLVGIAPFDTNPKQARFPAGLLAQIQRAGLQAWRRLPQKGSATTSLAKIRQGPDEPYSDFVARLNLAAERLLGPSESKSTFVKYLAFENANPACQDVLRPHKDKGELSDFIRLCAGVGTAHAMGLAIGAAFTKAFRNPGSRTCFTCKQPGHFARECPTGKQSLGIASPQTGAKLPPATLCPRCGKGRHWANECRSKTNALGQPISSCFSGNSLRGQPLAPTSPRTNPGAIRFVPSQTPNLPQNPSPQLPPSNEPPQAAQDWTSVPPPIQY
ncbi:endogenous retrovirus group K member 7 Gag polyprotein-like [Marmota flaviventris]|uniref:endogenous retrovirus group K member 7 Gag polyprotein-like n=1 Tax=Marmota flaviventris TaxID=93162 RepID=UPI003A8775D4